ncbi:MAG: glycosyltransferase [Fibrobacteraceae bacterium]|nr:glycosyltransferase [Fibrobacteraceae bacterium]
MSMQKNIRVCQVLHGIVGGGSEQVVLNYCSRMHDIHFDLLFQYEPNPQILERFNEAGINCIQIPDKVHHPLKHLWTMFRIFRKGDYNVVHSHLDWFMNSYVCFWAMLAGVKKRIAHHHQAYHPTNPLLILLCALMRIPCKLFATHWLACGEAAAINGWGKRAFEKSKVTILPNAIDPERFKFNETARHEIRVKYGIAENDFVVGHVGRFYPEKNHEFLIDVFSEVHKQKSNAKLLLLGDGPLREHIMQKVDSLELTNFVIFAGLQKNPELYYSAMDVFCLPSIREALGIVLLEAQYNGLPCVVSEAVPREVVISKSFVFLPLKSAFEWKKNLMTPTRENKLHSDKFNIKKYKLKLTQIYCGC